MRLHCRLPIFLFTERFKGNSLMGCGKYCFIGGRYETINNKAKMCVEIFANILKESTSNFLLARKSSVVKLWFRNRKALSLFSGVCSTVYRLGLV